MVSVARASAAGLCPEAHEATVSIVPVRLPYRLLSGLHQIDTVWTVLLQLQGSNECGIGYAFASKRGGASYHGRGRGAHRLRNDSQSWESVRLGGECGGTSITLARRDLR